jgi:hypothetical protein
MAPLSADEALRTSAHRQREQEGAMSPLTFDNARAYWRDRFEPVG